MNTSTTFLLALKGTCALNCLAALHLAGPLPVTQRTVMDLTGFDHDAVSRGLSTLRVLGLVTCIGNDRRTAWQLADAAQRLPLPLDPVMPSAGNQHLEPLIKEEEDEEIDSYDLLDSSLIEEAPSAEKPHLALPAEPPPVARPAEPSPSALPAEPPPSALLSPERRALRGQFYSVFEAAGIFLQFRRSLADALLGEADGLAWLRQALGWVCYGERRLPHVERGAVVFICLRDRLPCDPVYLPPPDLPFEKQLAWAMRGGQAEPEPDGEQTSPVPVAETPAVLSVSPEQELWQALIARLARDLSPAVIDSQLRPARLLSVEAERCLIAAATPQSRDWLSLRLAPVLARALSELAGRALAVEIVADQ